MSNLTSEAVGVLLLVASIAKFLRFDVFAAAVRDFRLIANPWRAFAVSMTIVAVEGLTGVALIVGREPWASATGMGLLVSFTCVVAFTLIRGTSPKYCGCLPSRRSKPVGWHMCIRNLALMTLLLPNLLNWPVVNVVLTAAFLACVSTVTYIVERKLRSRENHLATLDAHRYSAPELSKAVLTTSGQ